jgi:serine/threonine protein kinase
MIGGRDVKLENVFIGDDGRVRLGDFGLTMSMKQEMAISPVGTVEYMAPEVVLAPSSHACEGLL